MNRCSYIFFKVFSWIALALSLSSCLGIDEVGVDGNIVTEYPVKLSAGSYLDTRISHDNLSMAWQQSDTLKITAVASDESSATSKISIYHIDDNDASCASFAGFVSMLSQPQECFFMYPASAVTSYNASTGRVRFQYNQQTGRHEPMMYAKAAYDREGMYVEMKHAGAILQLTVSVDDLKSITFAGNKLENIYPIEIDPVNHKAYSTSEIGVQITVPVQNDGPTYICVPPVKLEKGFSLICTRDDGAYMVKSFSSDGSLSGGYDFSDKVGSLIPIEVSGDFENFHISADGLSGEHTKNGNLLTGTLVQFKMNKSGAPNKLFEEWGANLLNSNGEVVRTISYTNTTQITGQSVAMNVANNWKLLPAGDYIFTPYYKIYGQQTTLPSQLLTITDPGVSVKITGNTSYDKYKAGNVSGANSHTNTLIEGLAVSTNLDLSIVDSRDLKIDDSSIGAGTWSSGTMSFGNLTKTEFKTYECKATITVGNLTFTASRDFHITGLPIEVNFSNLNPTNLTPSWSMIGEIKYSDNRVNFVNGTTSAKQGALVTPKFWTVNSSLIVKTSFDACGMNVDFKLFGKVIDQAAYLDIYMGACAANASSVSLGSNVVRSEYKTSYSSGDYRDWSGNITLTSSKPSIMYAANSMLYDKAMYKVRVHYSN